MAITTIPSDERGRDALDSLTPTLLMGPGPSCVYPAVYEALAKPTIGHLDPRFISLMDDMQAMLRTLMGTANAMT
jgi:alanine-glyoxylate transaminase/serine-glyoxylate transaminase/serine-pyruvate transaminase